LPTKNNDDPPEFMTRVECAATMAPIQVSLARLENAIIGTDLSSGLVKKVSDLTAKVDNMIQTDNLRKAEQEKKQENKLRWKLVAFSFAGTLFGIILKLFIDKL
jgi:hypothetical protein